MGVYLGHTEDSPPILHITEAYLVTEFHKSAADPNSHGVRVLIYLPFLLIRPLWASSPETVMVPFWHLHILRILNHLESTAE